MKALTFRRPCTPRGCSSGAQSPARELLEAGAPARPTSCSGGDHFAVLVSEAPSAIQAPLAAQLQAGYGARLAAGYCWQWSGPRPDKTLVPDVTNGDWQRPWNLKGDRALPGAPPAALGASEPAGFGQVGCVYTAQGFEYDWNSRLSRARPGLARRRLRLPA